MSKKYGSQKIVDDFSYKFTKGERIGIIGRNGTGKTTFLNMISGSEPPDEGEINVGMTVTMAYYGQMGQEWKEEQRVIDAVKEVAEVVMLEDGRTISASQFLEHFMFSPDAQFKLISKLSGGELRRLHLLSVLIKNPNFLILDEPTNDLDLFALNTLEEFLLSFKGCLIIVSHDRYFLDKLTDHLFIFEGDGIVKDHYGTYSNYKHQRESAKKKSTKTIKVKTNEEKQKTKLSYKEQLEYSSLEAEIEQLEEEKTNLETELNSGILDYEILNRKSERISQLIELIDSKIQRWMELGEYI
jgi:ATP-binding cassette subfamily F protein uup